MINKVHDREYVQVYLKDQCLVPFYFWSAETDLMACV